MVKTVRTHCSICSQLTSELDIWLVRCCLAVCKVELVVLWMSNKPLYAFNTN